MTTLISTMKTETCSTAEEDYTKVKDEVVTDSEVTAIALAIYTYIRSQVDRNNAVSKKDVAARFGELGRISINKAWNILIEKGWIISNRIRGEHGRYIEWEHIIVDK